MGVEWYEAQGIEVRDTDRGGRVTYHGPGQLVAYPIVSLAPYGDDVHEYVRGLERVTIGVARRARGRGEDDRGPDRRLDRGGGSPARARARPRRARSARSGSTSAAGSPPTASRSTSTTTCSRSSGSSPAGSRAARVTSLSRELGAEQDLDAFAATVAARFGEVYERDPVADRRRPTSSSTCRPLGSGSHDDDDAGLRAHPRHPLPRQAGRNRRRGRRRRPLPPRPQAAVAEGPGPGRPHLPPPQGDDRRRQPAHRLRGGQLPQRRRVLGARHRDLHDPRRRLHPPLRLLQREDGRADLERPAGAAARRQPGEEDGAAPRRRHLGRPRRPARLRGERLRRRDPLDPDAGARLQGRGPHPRLPRPGDAAGQGDPRAPRRLQPQRRDGAAPLPEGAPRLPVPALGPGPAAGQGDGRRGASSPSRG